MKHNIDRLHEKVNCNTNTLQDKNFFHDLQLVSPQYILNSLGVHFYFADLSIWL